MKIDLEKKLVWLNKGTGFWALDRYPWGGDFKRFGTDVCLPIHTIVETYSDGSPRKLRAGTNGTIGIQL